MSASEPSFGPTVPLSPWPNSKGKCEQNFEAVKTYSRRRADFMYRESSDLKDKDADAAALFQQLQFLRHELEELKGYYGKMFRHLQESFSLSQRNLANKVETLERTLNDHRTVIHQLQKQLNMNGIQVSSSTVIPKPKVKRRIIKPHGRRQANND
jgi:uncharacterized protein YukE